MLEEVAALQKAKSIKSNARCEQTCCGSLLRHPRRLSWCLVAFGSFIFIRKRSHGQPKCRRYAAAHRNSHSYVPTDLCKRRRVVRNAEGSFDDEGLPLIMTRKNFARLALTAIAKWLRRLTRTRETKGVVGSRRS